ncbi:hypothetical protein AYJ54_01150 [Bradyrhizobium centrolobii]|uniref:DUF4238 domain-containing protein n=1 Tax=Bradyrhizobium centrolobii TaxID=1505087 RepID=A0A176YFZ0_9BRAD|nr:DUF4238 domain-containing protein [Bradyrhizobium centrolobii]OAF05541.1 hypothetical protein AYJ54_01150 [Bradyrhizobium centrolobii]
MALDHYISQVHLRNFYSPKIDRLYAMRKSDLKTFEPRSQDVCRIDEGNTNPYLTESRAIEIFLKSVEPNYNRPVELVRKNGCDQMAVVAIAGFAAYVLACSPASMRFSSDPLRASVQTTADILESQGKIDAPPPSLGYKSFSEMMSKGAVAIDIDPMFPQALAVQSILSWLSIFGNSRWDILLNEHADTPFFTSDFPIGFEQGQDPRTVNKVVPLTPAVAVRILPDASLSGAPHDFSFAKLRTRICRPARSEVVALNRLLVRCAENTVFFRDDLPWVYKFVKDNRNYRVEGKTERINTGNGYFHLSTQRVAQIER